MQISSDTGNILSQNGVKTALFQNMGNSKYLQAVFETGNSEAIASVFSKYRKPFKSKGRTVKETMRLVDECMIKVMNEDPADTPYTDETMDRANAMRMNWQV